jgi:Domain of unknown function (DUF4124)
MPVRSGHCFNVMRSATSFIITCVLCAAAPATHAQLYKWVDDSGVVNYGDWPPDGVKLQPVNHGTLSSVADRALVAPLARAPESSRSAPRKAGPAISERKEVSYSNAPAVPTDADDVGTYAPYYGYSRRPVAVAAELERRPANALVERPILPINPGIPEMPPRPRR